MNARLCYEDAAFSWTHFIMQHIDSTCTRLKFCPNFIKIVQTIHLSGQIYGQNSKTPLPWGQVSHLSLQSVAPVWQKPVFGPLSTKDTGTLPCAQTCRCKYKQTHFTQHRWDIDKVIMWPMYSKRAGTLGDRCSIIKIYKKQNKHDNKDTVLTIINATNFVQILHLRSFSKIFDITFRFSFSVVHQWMQHRQKCYNCSTSAIVVIKTNVARFYGTSRSFSL